MERQTSYITQCKRLPGWDSRAVRQQLSKGMAELLSLTICLPSLETAEAVQLSQTACSINVSGIQSDEKAGSHKDKVSAPAPETGPNAAAATPSAAPPTAGMATPRTTGGLTRQGSGRAGGTPKAKDTPKTAFKGASRGSKKTVPASFVEVIDCLVDITLRYKGMQPGEEADLADPVPEAMETEEPFTISAQLPDGRMVRVSATQPVRTAGAAAAAALPGSAPGPGQGAQGKPAAKASFTEQVRPTSMLLQHPTIAISSAQFAGCMGEWKPFRVLMSKLICFATASCVPSTSYIFRPVVQQGMPPAGEHCTCWSQLARQICIFNRDKV